jgi:hypothetical protein
MSIKGPKQTISPRNIKHFYKGNLEKDYLQSLKLKNGKEWLIGNFKQFRGSPRKTGLLELKYWKIGKNIEHKAKKQKKAGELTIVLKGWIKGVVGKKWVVLKQGEYICIRPNTVNNLVIEASDDAEGLTIKAPSNPKDCKKR